MCLCVCVCVLIICTICLSVSAYFLQCLFVCVFLVETVFPVRILSPDRGDCFNTGPRPLFPLATHSRNVNYATRTLEPRVKPPYASHIWHAS